MKYKESIGDLVPVAHEFSYFDGALGNVTCPIGTLLMFNGFSNAGWVRVSTQDNTTFVLPPSWIVLTPISDGIILKNSPHKLTKIFA